MSRVSHLTQPAAGPALRDIHLPPGPSWWPPAPGWWLLALMLVTAGFALAWWWHQRSSRRAIEDALAAEVESVLARHHEHPQQLASGLHQLLRRGALRHDPDATHQRGAQWRNTLAIVPVDAVTLDRLMSLESAMYRPETPFDIDATAAATRQWLVLSWRHRRRGMRAAPTDGPVVKEDPRHA